MDKKILKVPLYLDALLLEREETVTGPMADFSRLPYFDGRRDVQYDIANISESIINRPLQNKNLNLKKGVHLHWALPDALTRGQEAMAEDGTGTQVKTGSLQFPKVPDRWLVKRTKGTEVQEWIVESDYLHPEGLGLSNVAYPILPNPANGEKQPYRHMGRKMPLKLWQNMTAPSADHYLNQRAGEGLTAMGYDEPAFAAFYPNCHSIFGFHDEEITTEADARDCTYTIVGWYHRESDDFLKTPNLTTDELDNEYGWQLPEGTSDLPDRLVCYAHLRLTGFDRVPVAHELTVGYTGGEALSAYLGETLGADEREKNRIEEQLESIHLLDQLNAKKLDKGAKFKEARHTAEFDSVKGGHIWTLRYQDSDTNEEATLPEHLAHLLNQLNKDWQAFDQATDEIEDMRKQVFADWYKYMVAAYPRSGSLEEYPSADLVKYYIAHEAIPTLEAKVSVTGSVVLRHEQGITAIDTGDSGTDSLASQLKAQVESLLEAVTIYNQDEKINPETLSFLAVDDINLDDIRNYLRANNYIMVGADGFWTLTDTFHQLTSANAMASGSEGINKKREEIYKVLKKNLQLSRISAPRYYTPKEPVVMITGMEPTRRHGSDGVMDLDMVTTNNALTGSAIATALERLIPAYAEGALGSHAMDQRPWNPFLLEWAVELFPSKSGRNYDNDDWQYLPAFIKDNYRLDLENPELTYFDDGLVRGANLFSGRTYLTPYAKEELQTRVEAYLKDQGNPTIASLSDQSFNNPVYTVLRAKEALNNLEVLSQSLGGFNENLLMTKSTQALAIADVLGFLNYQPFTNTSIRGLVGGNIFDVPLPLGDFQPIRSGALLFTQLRVTDTFGQTVDVPVNDVLTTHKLKDTSGNNFIRLYPRFSQPARLNFHWLSAGHEEEEVNTHPAYSPVCGWVVPNNLTNSLSFYDQEGRGLGVIDEQLRWQQFPGHMDTVSVGDIANPHLQKLVRYLLGWDIAYLQSFINSLDSAVENIDPEDFAHNKALSILMGRPLALTRARITLQIKGQPAVDQGWNALRKDVKRKTRDTHAFTAMKVPIRLGEYKQLNDGLAGYWLEENGQLGDTYYAMESDTEGYSGIQTHKGGGFNLHHAVDDPPIVVSMLVDVRGAVHVTTGILPTMAIKVSEDQYAKALQKIEVNFLTAPILSAKGELSLSLPTENGYAWSFLQKQRATWTATHAEGIVSKGQLETQFGTTDLWEELLNKNWLSQQGALAGTEQAYIVSADQRNALSAPMDQQQERMADFLDGLYLRKPQNNYANPGQQVIKEGWLRLKKR